MNIGINFSKRKNGNCQSTLEFISEFVEDDFQMLNISELIINSCCDIDYNCFESGKCDVDDDFGDLLKEMRNAVSIYMAIPVYRGRLSSEYYKLMERLCGLYRTDDNLFAKDILSKMRYIIFANRGAGREQVEMDLVRDIEGYGCSVSVLMVSSRDFNKSSIEDRLINEELYLKLIREYCIE